MDHTTLPARTRLVALMTTLGETHTVQLVRVTPAGQIVIKGEVVYQGPDAKAAVTEQLRLRRAHGCEARCVTDLARKPEIAEQLARAVLLLICIGSLIVMAP